MIRKSTLNDKNIIQQLMLICFGDKNDLEPYENLTDRYLQVFRGSLPDFVASMLPAGLSLYGGSLWKKANSRKIKSVLWWCGSSPGRSPCGKPLSS